MSLQGFSLFILVLILGLLQGFHFLKHHFSGVDEYKKKIAVLEHRIEVERTRSIVALHEAETVRQEVAALLPNQIHNKMNYGVRKLASVLQAQEPLPEFNSEILLSQAKEEFRSSRYHMAAPRLKEIVERFPGSRHLPEVYFLLSESYFQMQAVESCVDTIETMVSLFPESELTGFSLLRLSAIYFNRKMDEQAVQVLMTVRNSFSHNRDLVEQANSLLKRAVP